MLHTRKQRKKIVGIKATVQKCEQGVKIYEAHFVVGVIGPETLVSL
jgi:hypothetical protein